MVVVIFRYFYRGNSAILDFFWQKTGSWVSWVPAVGFYVDLPVLSE